LNGLTIAVINFTELSPCVMPPEGDD
jgi:hypothetical protein